MNGHNQPKRHHASHTERRILSWQVADGPITER
jgi:hypothetical protein